MLKSFTIDQLYIGLSASSSHVITDEKIRLFADVTGDYNPIHLDAKFAEKTRFGKRIAHGMLVSSFISALFAMKLPGQGCIYLSQNLSFKKPVYINDTVIATVEVIAVDLPRKRVQFKTYCTVNNKIVIDGEAEIYIPD
ncbi:MaoC family dehydratase [Acinetobacter variabilis]|uniref:MaoC family dehydratase n=1 Tax=Acinetobacter variabilis TaxID=70346 RepID=UPI0021CD82FC|nr:MaoC family dehydratase [Acinetobacter variabilis]MCU4364247.1 MaoC family dehydratase [Acinetobacter variabilis]MCU4374418.1 MaoC family dehydratase [Acinetobacter variabilis]